MVVWDAIAVVMLGATADSHSHLFSAREIAENRLLLSAVSRSVYKGMSGDRTSHTSRFKVSTGWNGASDLSSTLISVRVSVITLASPPALPDLAFAN